jgi:hypothetical protein
MFSRLVYSVLQLPSPISEKVGIGFHLTSLAQKFSLHSLRRISTLPAVSWLIDVMLLPALPPFAPV